MVVKSIDDMLLRDEGLKLAPYTDTEGKWTIGIGRNIDDKGFSAAEMQDMAMGFSAAMKGRSLLRILQARTITKDEAFYLLENDIHEAEYEANSRFLWYPDLDEVRQAVVLNMIFNMGIDRYLGFKLHISAMGHMDYTLAGLEILDSKFAKQLPARAHRNAIQMQSGVWVQA